MLKVGDIVEGGAITAVLPGNNGRPWYKVKYLKESKWIRGKKEKKESSEGLTVAALIAKLETFNPEAKVCYYDEKGREYPVFYVVEDTENLVTIF